MPDGISSFLLDDTEEDEYGFDAPMSPEEEEEVAKPKGEDQEPEVEPEVDVEPEEVEDQTGEQTEPEEETAQPEQQAEPEYVTQLRQSNELMRQNLAAMAERQKQTDERFNTLQQTIQQQQKQQAAPEPPPYPTEDQFAEDPVNAAQMVAERKTFELRQQINKETEERLKQQAEEQQAREQQAQFTAAVNNSWEQAVKVVPNLGVDGTEERNLFARIYNNPANGLTSTVNGPLLAMGMVRAHMQSQTQEKARNEGVKSEQSRQARVKAGNMYGSGTGGGKAAVTGLTSEQEATARKFGISKEAFAATLKEMEVG